MEESSMEFKRNTRVAVRRSSLRRENRPSNADLLGSMSIGGEQEITTGYRREQTIVPFTTT
jgi:hypothetical protein